MTTHDAPATTLHYIFDPLCGWCYGAAPLIEATVAVNGIKVSLHAGGMMIDADRRNISTQWREFVLPHDRRIADVSGQSFGAPYFDVLLRDTTAVLDSEPPITAVLAAEALGQRGFDLLHAIQKAHYVRGMRIAELPVLTMLAAEIGLEVSAFEGAFERISGDAVRAHIAESRKLLSSIGGRGFPTVALRVGDKAPVLIDVSTFLGRPQAWVEHLAKLMDAAAPASAAGDMACSIESCAPA